MAKPKTALILGGGLAGLTCAYELARAGVAVTVLEKEATVGGLARNFQHDGGKFDLGGHRFFTDKPELLAWLRELLADDLLEVPRKSRIRLHGRYFDYPLRAINALSGFGLRETARILADFSLAAMQRALSGAQDLSLEDWVTRRFGRRLYEIYFQPYSQKTWGLPCDQISAVWAAQRIQLLGLADAERQALAPTRRAPKTYAEKFWYPTQGIGVIGETLAAKIEQLGGRVLTATPVQRLVAHRDRIVEVVAAGEARAAELVISTMPLPVLGGWLGAPAAALARLRYRAVRCLYLLLDRERVTDDTWLYFPEAELPFGRSHEPRNWAPALAPPTGTSLVLEFFCNEGDELWSRDEDELAARCAADLTRLGLIERDEMRGHHGARVADAYPVFTVGFQRPLKAVTDHLASFANLRVLGRTGAYRYDNMDQVIDAALVLAREVAR